MHHVPTRTLNYWRTLAAIGLLFLQAACFVPHAQMVRDAQDAFSKGAAIDNLTKIGAQDEFENPESYYSLAFGLIENALREAEDDLQADDLYGTAMTIKALAAWRLGDAGEARDAAAAVVQLAKDDGNATKVWPRDHAVCVSLEGLIGIDLLAAAVQKIKAESLTVTELESLVMQEVDGIDATLTGAASKLPTGHPLRLYLTQSRAELALVVGCEFGSRHVTRPS